MTCVICKNGETVPGETLYTGTEGETIVVVKTVPGETLYTGTEGETIVVVKNVPAKVCDNCGEAYVSSETVAHLREVLNDSADPNEEIVLVEYRERAKQNAAP